MQENTDSKPESKPKWNLNLSDRIVSVLSGNILVGDDAHRAYIVLIKVAIVVFFYMTNGYSMISHYRTEASLKREIKELRVRSVTFSSALISATRQSEISRQLKSRGISVQSSRTPHKVLE